MKDQGIVAVTGAAGFLGQHIVKHLHQCPLFAKIRVFDIKDYQQMLDFVPMKPVEVFKGDLGNLEDLANAFKGIHTVIHTAGLVDVSMFPDKDRLYHINVTGTKNVILACIKCNIESLVSTSTVDVVIGYNSIRDGNEMLIPPKALLWAEYATTKLISEQLVCSADGSVLGNGSVLKTAVIRPNVMYGEGDPHFINKSLEAAKQNFGWIPRLGNGTAKFQFSYVGNTAWAHIKAAEALMDKSSPAGGQAFFAPDDTPIKNTSTFLEPFLHLRGYTVSKFYIPYFVIYLALLLMTLTVFLMRSVVKINPQNFTLKSMKQLNITTSFTRKNAEKYLGYKPIYSFEESFKASAAYYKNIPL